MLVLPGLAALVDVDAVLRVEVWRRRAVWGELIAGQALARVGGLGVDTGGGRGAGVRRGRRQGCRERALVHVGAVGAVAPVAGSGARAGEAAGGVSARGPGVAAVCVGHALVDVVARNAVARVARRARAREGAGVVGAVVGIEAVVRARRAFVDLRARVGGGQIAAATRARAADEVGRLGGAGEARGGRSAAARAARGVAGRAARCRARVVVRRADSEARAAVEEGRV